jgi:hypothetical protein
MANRDAGSRSAELPAWMGEGLAEMMSQRAVTQLTLESNLDYSRQLTRRDTLQGARRLLQSRPPLGLESINWPTPDLLEGGLC